MSDWRLSRRARSDLAEIWRFTHSRWGLEQADRYVAKIYEAFGKLAAKPSLGRPLPYDQKDTRKYRCGSHLIFHRRRRKQVYIVRILHESMDHGRHLRLGRRLGQAERRPNMGRVACALCWVIAWLDPTYMGSCFRR